MVRTFYSGSVHLTWVLSAFEEADFPFIFDPRDDPMVADPPAPGAGMVARERCSQDREHEGDDPRTFVLVLNPFSYTP